VPRPLGWGEIDDEARAILRNYGDGTPFFDHLDARLTDPYFFDILVRMLQKPTARLYNYLPPIAVSGKFGWAFSQWVKKQGLLKSDLIVFPGDLRHQDLPEVYWGGDNRVPVADKYVYLDNSIYKGRTLNKIKAFLKRNNTFIERAYVCYDGSLPPHKLVKGLPKVEYIYRWHEDGIRTA
jgi:hypothetical protein